MLPSLSPDPGGQPAAQEEEEAEAAEAADAADPKGNAAGAAAVADSGEKNEGLSFVSKWGALYGLAAFFFRQKNRAL